MTGARRAAEAGGGMCYLSGMRIYLLEPYFTGSHRQWAEGLRDASRHEVHLITHEGRFWKWRLGGGFVTMAEELAAAVASHGPPDLLLASSMLDLAGLLGLARGHVGECPAGIYFHENQITYPEVGRTRAEAALGLANWSSLLAAHGVAFNSEFHLAALFDALPRFLGGFPDRRHDALIERARTRSVVVPVGVDLQRIGPRREGRGPITFLWNHRWDPDKAVGGFLDALGALAAEGLDFEVILAGESFVDQAASHREAIRALGDRVVRQGYLDDIAYVEALHAADVVVSTARQEFFGVSVVEAMGAGAFPVLPDRLVYPERVPPELHDRCLYRSRAELVSRLRWTIEHPVEARRIGAELCGTVAGFDWAEAGPRTDAWLESTAAVSVR